MQSHMFCVLYSMCSAMRSKKGHSPQQLVHGPNCCWSQLILGMQDMDVPAALKDADSTREAQLLESWKAYKKGFQEGIALFNKKPKKGIAFMQVGSFLLRCPCIAASESCWHMY